MIDRMAIARNFVTSDEYRSRILRGWYKQYLFRDPGAAEVQQWLTAIRNGQTTLDEVFARVVASPEFAQQPTFLMQIPWIPSEDTDGFPGFPKPPNTVDNGHWLRRMYWELWVRLPDEAGYNNWLARLNSGVPRFDVAMAFFNSDENLQKKVVHLYELLMQRRPKGFEWNNPGTELQDGIAFIRANGQDSFIAYLASSHEFFANTFNRVLAKLPPNTSHRDWCGWLYYVILQRSVYPSEAEITSHVGSTP